MILLGWATVAIAASKNEQLAARVVVLANKNDADSVEVAEHYAKARGVPAGNIIALPMSTAETISWKDFVNTIWQPLQDALLERGWLKGVTMDLVDAVGRKKNAVAGHRISYLVVCRGVPLRVNDDPALRATLDGSKLPAQVRTMQAAVDSELALLAQVDPAVLGLVPNPLFNQTRPSDFKRGLVIKVSRLDGPTRQDALALVDRAIAAERQGVVGRAYVDLGGPHAQGDKWLEATIAPIEQLGLDLDVDRNKATLPLAARCDEPVLYFGWYATNLNGAFLLPGFRFAPGAVALHIHSYSAHTLRSPSSGWTGPLVARGVTATVGNVFEPYLDWTHRPDILMLALSRGENWGDAVCYAIPAFSWQAIAIGDPLYRPFARKPADVWAKRAELPASLVPYAAMQQMNLSERAGNADRALTLGRTTQRTNPGLALALALAGRMDARHQRADAVQVLQVFGAMKTFRAQDWALAVLAAERLRSWGRAADAVPVYAALIEGAREAPVSLRRGWLQKAEATATEAGNFDRASAWRQQLRELTPDEKG